MRNRLELVEDMVIGRSEPADPNYLFSRILDLEVDENGSIYVFAYGAFGVRVFDSDGVYRRTIGGRGGQGPGDFKEGGRIAVTRNLLFYTALGVLHSWELTGEFVDARNTDNLLDLSGAPDDGHLAAAFWTFERNTVEPGLARTWAVARVFAQGDMDTPYASFAHPFSSVQIGDSMIGFTPPRGEPSFAQAADGTIYASPGTNYEVVSFSPAGGHRWSLRVASSRYRFTDSDIATAMKALRRIEPAATSELVEWPEFWPALDWQPLGLGSAGGRGFPLFVDGHGHVYVFPFVPERHLGIEDRAVDVYSPRGELLFQGIMPNALLMRSWSDFAYGVSTSNSDQEETVVRWRLVEPFGSP
jgi:hypothetical protein